MRRIREVLRLYAALGHSISAVAKSAGMSRSTVREYLQRAQAAKIDAVLAAGMTDEGLEAALFPPPTEPKRPRPDWAKVDAELRRHKHVTRKLLWLEYKADHPDGYEFSQFNLLLSEWQKASGRGMSMRQVHHAGAAVQVDYAGDTVTVRDQGMERQAQIFVACLPCSGLIYAEATWTQGQEDWLASHVRLFAFLGGVPAKIMLDYVPRHIIRFLCPPPLCGAPPGSRLPAATIGHISVRDRQAIRAVLARFARLVFGEVPPKKSKAAGTPRALPASS